MASGAATSGGGAGGVGLAAPRERPSLLGAAAFVAAPLLGALFAYVSYRYNPLVLPALLLVAVVMAATLSRPQVGIAFAIALIAFGPVASPEVFGLIRWQPWVVPTVWIAFVFVVGITAASAAGSFRLPQLAIPLGLFLLAGMISFPVADSLAGGLPIVRMLVTGAMLFTVTAICLRERAQFSWIMRGTAVAAMIAGGAATYEELTGTTSGGSFLTSSGEFVGRATAGFPHPNALGGFLLIMVPIIVAGLMLDRRRRWLYAIGLFFAVAGIYYSASRGAMVGLVAVPLVFLRPRHLLMVAPVAAAILVLATPTLIKERFANIEEGTSIGGRSDIWSTAADIWQQNPLVGVGLGGFGDAYAQARVPGKDFLPDTVFTPPPHAHNIFLQYLAEEGLVGFVALVVLLVAAGRLGFRVRGSPDPWLRTMGSAMVATLIAFLIHNQFDVTLIAETGDYFFVFLGLTSALATLAARGQPGPGDSVAHAR